MQNWSNENEKERFSEEEETGFEGAFTVGHLSQCVRERRHGTVLKFRSQKIGCEPRDLGHRFRGARFDSSFDRADQPVHKRS